MSAWHGSDLFVQLRHAAWKVIVKTVSVLLQNAASVPECKYGADCYQQNADHRRKFHHPPPQAVNKPVPPSKPEADKHSAADVSVPSGSQVLHSR